MRLNCQICFVDNKNQADYFALNSILNTFVQITNNLLQIFKTFIFMSFPEFFNQNEFFIDEKVAFLKFANQYKIFNNQGQQIAKVNQRLGLGEKILRLFVGKKILPFRLDICDTEDKVISSVVRGLTLWMSKIEVQDSEGRTIGFIKQQFRILNQAFLVFDNSENQIATITGDWSSWNFEIQNNQNQEIGTVSKKWAGGLKEIFTDADKYQVMINPEYAEDTNKIIILSAAITIDMVLKETND